MRYVLVSALLSSLAYASFLGHRSDYLGHYLAGFGGMLLLLVFPMVFWKRSLGWAVPILLVLAIAAWIRGRRFIWGQFITILGTSLPVVGLKELDRAGAERRIVAKLSDGPVGCGV